MIKSILLAALALVVLAAGHEHSYRQTLEAHMDRASKRQQEREAIFDELTALEQAAHLDYESYLGSMRNGGLEEMVRSQALFGNGRVLNSDSCPDPIITCSPNPCSLCWCDDT